MCRNPPFLRVSPVAGAEEDDGGQGDPAAHRMYHDRPGEVMELLTIVGLEPRLDAKGLIPGNSLEQRVDEADDQEGRRQLRVEPGPLGDAARNDSRNRRREGQQKKELGQFEAILLHQRLGTGEEVDTVGDAVADEEVGDRRYREVGEDLHQRIDLALLADRAQFEEGKARMHRQHHDATEQDEENVATRLECFHGSP